MPDSKTNLRFLKGLQSALPTSGTSAVKDGAFYLTTDSHRLYAGIGQDLVDLNKSITVVENLTALNNIAAGEKEPGTFYYVEDLNVLAVYKEIIENGSTVGSWVQINPDTITTVNSDSFSTANVSGENSVSVTSALNITSNANSTDKSSVGTTTDITADFVIKGGTNVEVMSTTTGTGSSAKQNAIQIRANEYNLAATSSGNNNFGVQLQTTGSSGTATDVTNSNFSLNAGDNITFDPSIANRTLSISSTDTKVNSLSTTFGSNGTLTVGVTSTTGLGTGSASDTVTPEIKYGVLNQQDSSYSGSAVFNSGTAVLNVYTQTEVDNKIDQSLTSYNALEYKGEMTSLVKSEVETNGAPIGSLYKVTEEMTFGTAPNTTTWYVGDSVIVTPADNTVEEDESGVIKGNDITWVVVPSGDDDISYVHATASNTHVFTQNGKNKYGTQIAAIANGNVEVTSSTTSNSSYKTSTGNDLPVFKTEINLVWETF